MFDILDGEKLTAISAGLDDVPDLIFGDTETRAYLEAQKNHTLKQVYDWGNKGCPHTPRVNNIFKRRSCPKCWQELQNEIDNG